MEEKEMKENKMHKVKEQVEEKINNIMTQGIKPENIDNLYKFVDIHKDLANEEYWKNKEEVMEMRYRYGEYSEGNRGGNYGRNYREYGEGYGARGRGRERDSQGRFKGGRGRYRGEEMLEEMQYSYGEYSEGREEYNRGNYGAKNETLKSLEYMMESVVDFIEMLKEDATSQEEIEMIKKYSKKISEM